MFTIKKVPILGDMERGLDNSIKELMGPLSMVYPLLKYGLIFSNPASALAYTGYRSIPYVLDALTSKKAIDTYKSMGKSVGTGLLRLGANTSKLSFKYGRKMALNLGELGKKQIDNVTSYFRDKDLSLNKFKDKFKNIELIDDYSVSNNYEEPFVENYIIKKEQTRVENNIKAASFLYDFNTDEMIQKSRAKIKQDVVNYQPHIKDFEEVVDISDVKEDKIEKEEDIVEILPNGNVRYRDVDGSITTRLATPFDKERFNSKYDSVSLEQRGNADIFNSKDVDVKEDSIKISSNCSVIFEKNEDGSYMQTYKFGDMLGQGMKITEEQYKQFKLDAKGLNKGKEKEKEYELDM